MHNRVGSNLLIYHLVGDIPAIVVDAFPATPPMTTRDITSPYQTPVNRSMEYDRNIPMVITPGILQSPDVSFAMDTPSRPLQRRHRTSDVSMLSIDMSSRHVIVLVDTGSLADEAIFRLDGSMSRDSRAGGDDDVLSSMQNSMWQGKCDVSRVYEVCLRSGRRHDARSRGGGTQIGLLYVIIVAHSLHIPHFLLQELSGTAYCRVICISSVDHFASNLFDAH